MPKAKTFRRFYLNNCLQSVHFNGRVLDVGGHKFPKKGKFEPPKESIKEWHYLNYESGLQPDILASADSIPVKAECYDMAVCTEVLEHLANPVDCLKEIHRILMPGGIAIISMPFQFHLHSEPFDYQRWTRHKHLAALEAAGFRHIKIEEMGSTFAVIHDILVVFMLHKNTRMFKYGHKALKRMFSVFKYLDTKYQIKSHTTGYFITAVK